MVLVRSSPPASNRGLRAHTRLWIFPCKLNLFHTHGQVTLSVTMPRISLINGLKDRNLWKYLRMLPWKIEVLTKQKQPTTKTNKRNWNLTWFMISCKEIMLGWLIRFKMKISDMRLSCNFLLRRSVAISLIATSVPCTLCLPCHTTENDPAPICFPTT